MKYVNEIKAITKLINIFSALFWILVSLLIFLLIGAGVIVAVAVQFRESEDKSAVYYLLLSYVLTILLTMIGFFFTYWYLNRFIKSNAVALLLYKKQYVINNPFNMKKEINRLKKMKQEIKSGSGFNETKSKYF